MSDATQNKFVGVTMPQTWYDQIVERLKPMQTVQDVIRDLIDKYLQEVTG
jgi:hypothetical protein